MRVPRLRASPRHGGAVKIPGKSLIYLADISENLMFFENL
jgi:hypothetical protein